MLGVTGYLHESGRMIMDEAEDGDGKQRCKGRSVLMPWVALIAILSSLY